MTENHDLNEPAAGTIDWNIPINENFEKIDTHLEIRDLEENLDQYTPKSGAKFLATDTGTRYLADGSQWNVAPVHLPDVVNAPTYSGENPTETTTGELWYRSDMDTLLGQFQAGVVDLVTGDVVSTSDTTDSGDTTDSSDATDDSGSTTTSHTLEFTAADGASWDNYSAVIDGTVTDTTNTNSGDTITEQSDGTLLIEGGLMGGKDPEIYDFDGKLLSLTLELDGTAYLDGEPIDPAEY